MDINFKISARILALVNSGKTLPEAFDATLGQGAFSRLAGELYEEMRRS